MTPIDFIHSSKDVIEFKEFSLENKIIKVLFFIFLEKLKIFLYRVGRFQDFLMSFTYSSSFDGIKANFHNLEYVLCSLLLQKRFCLHLLSLFQLDFTDFCSSNCNPHQPSSSFTFRKNKCLVSSSQLQQILDQEDQ